MVENQDPKLKPHLGLPAYQGSGKTEDVPIEDLNSTMMGLETGSFQDETRQNIHVELTNDDLEISEKVLPPVPEPWYKKFFATPFSFVPKRPASSAPVSVQSSRAWQGLWLANDQDSLVTKVFFYVSRLWLIVFGLVAQFVLFQAALQVYQNQHPARVMMLAVVVVNLLLVALMVVRRFSPVWILTLPFAALALIFAYGTIFYDSTDVAYFALLGRPLAGVLNVYFLFVFLFLTWFFYGGGTRRQIGRVLWGILLGLSLVPVVLQMVQNVDFATGFWGYGALNKIKSQFFQPTFILVHALLPLWLILILVKSVLQTPRPTVRAAYRALLPLFLSLVVLGFCLMQEQRVFHLFNLFLPQKLSPAVAQFDDRGHTILLKTKSATASVADTKVRYRLQLKENVAQKQYDLDVWENGDKPVHALTKADFEVWVDGVATDDFSITTGRANAGYAFKMDLKAREQAILMSPVKKDSLPTDVLEVMVLDPSRLQKIAYLENNQILFEKTPPFAEKWQIPLSSFSAGDHQGTVVAYGDNEQELIRFQAKFSLPETKSFFIVSPFDEDDVGDLLPVRLGLKALQPTEIQKITCRIGETTVFESVSYASVLALDLSRFADGNLKIAIELTTPGGLLEHTLNVRKTTKPLPELAIVSPAQGSFAQDETPIAFELPGNTAQILGVRVQVNGVAFEDFEIRANRFVLPTKRWRDKEIYISLQGTLETGEKISDWLQINHGAAILKLQFQGVGPLFATQKKLAVVLDATQSSVDFWYGRSLWETTKDALLAGDVQNKISEQNPKFWVFGAQDPAYFQNCDDVSEVAIENFSRAILKKKLDELKPTGMGSVVAAVKAALADKPDKVLLITDGLNECGGSVDDLAALWATATTPRFSVVSFAPVAAEDRQALTELVQKTQGAFYEPSDPDTLAKMLGDDLNVTFALNSQNALIKEGPLKDQELPLAPGDYVLSLPLPGGTKEIPIHLDHGLKKTLIVSGKGGKLQVEESSVAMP